MYICIFSLSFSRLSFSLTFSLFLSLALSLSFCLSISLFSSVVSRCVSAGLCQLVSLYVMHACALVLFLSNLFCLSFSLAFFLLFFPSLFLFFLYTPVYIPKLGSLHETPLVWLHLKQLFGKRLTGSQSLNVAEVSHTRCLPPVVAQVSHIFVHFHALSVLGGGSLIPWSFHRSLQSINLSLQSVLCCEAARPRVRPCW